MFKNLGFLKKGNKAKNAAAGNVVKRSSREQTKKDNSRSVMHGPDEGEPLSQTGNKKDGSSSMKNRKGGSSQNSRRGLTPEKSPECKKLVHSFVENTLKKGVMGLRAEFLSHKRINDLPHMTVFSKNAPKNRYKDVGCLDETRVVLKDSDSEYIHANYVGTPSSEKRFICCQAPLDSTCGDHWRMIVQEKCEVILMLCNLTEKGAKKCAEYFPSPECPSKTFDKYTVKCVEKKKIPMTFRTTAVINVTTINVEVDGKVVHTVNHYHWVDWPDRGVPPADQAPIYLLKLVMDTGSPVIVHCSAGIGRTGSIVLIQSTLESINAQLPCEHIDVLLLRLRKQRANSVQTDQQYLFVHQVLLNYFLKEGYLDKSVIPFLDTFTTEYKKAVIIGS